MFTNALVYYLVQVYTLEGEDIDIEHIIIHTYTYRILVEHRN